MEEAINHIHADENWKQSLRSEAKRAQEFKSNWGYLCYDGERVRRPRATTLVKYFNSKGGQWTVEPKCVPIKGTTRLHSLSPDVQEKFRKEYFSSPATERAIYSHSRRMNHISKSDAAFATNSQVYGSRLTLEQFGVSAYGRKAVLARD